MQDIRSLIFVWASS